MHNIAPTVLAGWLMVFVPLGFIGLGLWALWRLIPRFRRTSGYGTRSGKHTFSR